MSETDNTYYNRPLSAIVNWLSKKSNKSRDEISKTIGFSREYFDNKLYRDSFTVDDIVSITYICGYRLTIVEESKVVDPTNVIVIDPERYLEVRNPDRLEKIHEVRENERNELVERYFKLKSELEARGLLED